MDHMITSDKFPIRMPLNDGDTSNGTLFELDADYSEKETEGDGAEIEDIDIFTINEPNSPGEILEIIELLHAEPASISQFAFSELLEESRALGLRVVALRHSVLINEEEYNFYADPNKGICISKLDETVQFQPGCAFAIIWRKPIGIAAAA